VGLDAMVGDIIAWLQAHHEWLIPAVFILACGESLAFISLLLPATTVLLGLGAFMGAGNIAFLPIWATAAAGAACGDWISFWIGRRFNKRIAGVWPLSRNPGLLPRAHNFCERWGVLAVFFGRFTGPLRATVPLAAGICDMPRLRFQIANVASALLWATAVLAPGDLLLRWLAFVRS
jgi:membrane protein DedA with SNARE-associated domain